MVRYRRYDLKSILVVNVLYHPLVGGGAEITIKNLYEGLVGRGFVVNVLTFHDKGRCEECINGVRVFREKIPNLYLPLFINRKKPNIFVRRLWHLVDVYNLVSESLVRDYIDNLRPDIIISHNLPGFSPSIWEVAFNKGIPIIQVLHDLYLLCPTNMFRNEAVCSKQCKKCHMLRLFHRQLSNRLTAVVGISNFILNKFLSHDYFNRVPIKRVIHNSRKIELVRNFVNQNQCRHSNKWVTFGYIGNIAPNKGVEILLKAYLKVKAKYTELLIAGSGEESYLKYLREEYSDVNIKWLGWIDPKCFFTRVDFTIVPSIWYENFPGVLIESFAYGVPVIASNIGGIPEMVVEGKNGLLFDPGNEEDLAEKLELAVGGVEYWRKRREVIRKSGRKFLDYKKWVTKWEELILECI